MAHLIHRLAQRLRAGTHPLRSATPDGAVTQPNGHNEDPKDDDMGTHKMLERGTMGAIGAKGWRLGLVAMLTVMAMACGSGGEEEDSGPSWSLLSQAHAQRPVDDATALSGIAERGIESVVHITTMGRARRRGPSGPQGLGSGVIVDKKGLVLTNNHVIENASEVIVSLSDGRKFDAEIVGTDPKSDLAVLRLEGNVKKLKPMKFGDSGRLRLGEFVLAIGNPFGLSGSVTLGIVSATGRANVGIVDYEDFIQTDAAINPGNSGGALVNMRGELVGINTAILSRSGGYQGIGFSIPSNMVRTIMDELVKNGRVRRGWLGIRIEDVTPAIAREQGMKDARGVLVRSVMDNSPAAAAGIKEGDVVLKINGKKVDSSSRLRNIVALEGVGVKTTFTIFRDGKSKDIEVKLGELPE